MPISLSAAPLRLCLAVALIAGCGGRPAQVEPQPITTQADARVHAPPAPPAPDVSSISRADCLRLALANNRTFRIRHSALERARFGRSIAYAQVYAPRLDATYTMANTDDSGSGRVSAVAPALGFDVAPFVALNYAQNGQPATGGDAYTTSYGVTVSRRLFNIHEMLRQRLPITIADKEYYVATNNVVLEGKKLALETTRTFLNVQRIEARLRVRSRRVEDAREFLVVVTDSVAHGFKAPVDELNASINLNQAEADLLEERTNLQNAKERLLSLLAMPLTAPLGIVPERISDQAPVAPDIERDVVRVKTHHEDLGNQLAEIDLEIDQLRIQHDLLMPQLTAAFTAQHDESGIAAFDGSTSEADIYKLTFTYNLPLDFNRAARARYHQIRRQLDEKSLALHDAEANLEGQLRSSGRRIEQLIATVELAKRRLSAEQGRMEATLNRYKAGNIDNLEVTRSKQDLDNAEIALLDAEINSIIAESEYRAIMPQPVAPQAPQAPAP
ncbi:MAG: TolC family protein [Planctomycetes bacterium]|nr:TolC family protein [Planctomycetota bacterium]